MVATPGGGRLIRGLTQAGMDVGLSDVATKDIDKVFLEVTFGGVTARPNGARLNAIRTQLLRQPNVSDLLAVAQLSPGTIGETVQAVHQFSCENAVGLV